MNCYEVSKVTDKGHLGPLNCVDQLSVERLTNFEKVVQYLFKTNVFMVSVLRSPPNHPPLKYTYLIMTNN